MPINLLRNNIPLFSMSIIFLIAFFLILSTHYNWNKSMSKYLPLKSNIQTLKNDLSIGHLWLEEAISGDKYINLKNDVKDKFAHKKFDKYMIDVKNIFNSKKDLYFYNELLKIKELVHELEEISIQRWENKADYQIGSDLDQIFDEVFKDMIYLIDNLNDKIDDSLEKEFRDRKQYFRIIITLFLFVNIVVLTLLYKIKKRKF